MRSGRHHPPITEKRALTFQASFHDKALRRKRPCTPRRPTRAMLQKYSFFYIKRN